MSSIEDVLRAIKVDGKRTRRKLKATKRLNIFITINHARSDELSSIVDRILRS